MQVVGAILFGARMRSFLCYLPAFTKLRIVASFGTGTNHLDLARFTQLGVRVSNTPDVLNDAVAEMTLTLMLAAARRIVPGSSTSSPATSTSASAGGVGNRSVG